MNNQYDPQTIRQGTQMQRERQETPQDYQTRQNTYGWRNRRACIRNDASSWAKLNVHKLGMQHLRILIRDRSLTPLK